MGGRCCKKKDYGVGAEFATSQEGMIESGDENKERGNWSGRFDFILSCLGYAVGLGNVWRFPYLAYTYGGAIFLIPYAFSSLLIGLPIFFLELSVGQFTSSGPLTMWKMAPAFQGVGAAMLVVSCILGIYYNMIIGWAIYYLIASFTQVHLKRLPWTYCDKEWATPFCEDFIQNFNSALNCSMFTGYQAASGGGYVPLPNGLCYGLPSNYSNWFETVTDNSTIGAGEISSFYFNNETVVWSAAGYNESMSNNSLPINYATDAGNGFLHGLVGIWNETISVKHNYKRLAASSEYFNRRVLRLHKSSGMMDLGELHWDLALSLLAAWVIVFLCLIKGIKSSGKVVYFTALFPYAMLIVLAIRGSLLEGSLNGVSYYVRGYGIGDAPEDLTAFYSEKLGNVAVWKAAAEQVFFSLSTCYGGLIALASYNKFHTNPLRNTLIIGLGDWFTSFFAGFVIFSYIGALANSLGVKVDQVAENGIGLAFEVYPNAITLIPPDYLTPLWSILFFVMLLTLGLDSEFALIETILTSICDVVPQLRPRKTLVIAGVCSVMFLMGLSLCSSGGLYVLNLLDSFGAGWNVFLIAVLEAICIIWVYGHRNHFTRFTDDIRTMLGTDTVLGCVPWKGLRWFWTVQWGIITPGICIVLMIYSLYSFGGAPPLSLGSYKYEIGFIVLGWLITGLIVVCVVAGFIIALYKAKWDVLQTLRPTRFWGPALEKHRKLCKHCPDMEANPWESSEFTEASNDDITMSYKSRDL